MDVVLLHELGLKTPSFLVRKIRSTSPKGFAIKLSGVLDATKSLKEISYELEKVLLRIYRGLRFHVPVWLPLVREADAWGASGSANTLAN